MKKRVNLSIIALLVVAIFITISYVNPAFASRAIKPEVLLAKSDSDDEYRNEAGIREIYKVLQILRDEYISEVDTNSLMRGALKGIKDYLKLKRQDVSGLKDPILDERTPEANLRAFGKEYNKILMIYGGEFNEQVIVDAALKGMAKVIQKTYDDPYTVAMDKKEFHILQEQLNSRGFSGIGIFMEMDRKAKKKLMVVEPIEGTPAYKAGLKPGDYILRINGVSTRGMSMDSASSRIRGAIGSEVILTIRRRNVKSPFDVKIKRKNIVVSSLKQKLIGNIGYIRLRFFGQTTKGEFENALIKLHRGGAKALVLDLRNNGGGYIRAAVYVCSHFVDPETVITSVVNYRKGNRDANKSYDYNRETLPLVILVNEYSASASEITAGCMQDLGKGVLIGAKTFGKGSVQTIYPVKGGGAIKYTSAHYLTPKGRDINKKGINPDIKVKMDPIYMGGKKDIQLQKALRYLKRKMSRK
ncbi:MAG: S41 family peptidase [Candidatus Eremiobacteraeota bacterium]|nr:S41 family peptidase [Candidatus Eremiobacteraeota bacterium]